MAALLGKRLEASVAAFRSTLINHSIFSRLANLEFVDVIKNNMRSLLQNVNIKVYVYEDRIEVRGMIPTETISLSTKTIRESRELVIPSVRRRVLPEGDKGDRVDI